MTKNAKAAGYQKRGRFKNLIRKILIITAVTLSAVLIPFIVFYTRPPVLLVAEEAFFQLYGEQRIKDENFASSRALLRPVRIISVANDAGDDIVPHSITEVSKQPFCVLFPVRFSRSARLYKDLNPDIPVIILEGRSSNRTYDFDYMYKTDIESDFNKAGMAASLITSEGKIAIFLESSIDRKVREAFSAGFDSEIPPEINFYTNFSNYSEQSDLSCAVLAGIGGEFLEKNINIPVISFSWLDCASMPSNVFLVVNDSPLAQTKEAVRLFSAGEKEGLIKSKFHTLKGGNVDKQILRKIQKMM